MLASYIQKRLTTDTYSIHRPRLCVCVCVCIIFNSQPFPNPRHCLVVCRSETLAQGAELLSAIPTSQIPFKSQTGHRTRWGQKNVFYIWLFWRHGSNDCYGEARQHGRPRERTYPGVIVWSQSSCPRFHSEMSQWDGGGSAVTLLRCSPDACEFKSRLWRRCCVIARKHTGSVYTWSSNKFWNF